MWNTKDETGNRYGRLVVVERGENHVKRNGAQYAAWVCRCDCGKTISVPGDMLRNGKKRSCGCLRKETTAKLNYTHGETKTRLYMLWRSMKNRCSHPAQDSYRYYGGKGVGVCSEWENYENFRDWALSNGYTDELSIDRINPELDYCPQNCRWIPFEENNIYAHEKLVTVNGLTMNRKQWSEYLGYKKGTVTSWFLRHGENYAKERIKSCLEKGRK